MIDVYRIPLSPESLGTMSLEERTLFLRLGYAANQINVFFKFVILSSNRSPNGVEGELSGAQTQMLVRILTGVLYEAWMLVKNCFLAAPLANQYLPLIDADGRNALETLKSNFGKSNILPRLRNNYIFHHPTDSDVEAAFASLSSDADLANHWHWYFSHSNFNAFYLMSDLVVMHGICRAINETDVALAQERLMNEVSLVSNNLTRFIMALIAALWRKHFGDHMPATLCEKVNGAPSLHEAWIPFFVEVDELLHSSDQTKPLPVDS